MRCSVDVADYCINRHTSDPWKSGIVLRGWIQLLMRWSAGWEARGVSAKQEGVALVNSCVVALAEDNDFGLEGQSASAVTFVQLDRCLPRYGGGAYDVCV